MGKRAMPIDLHLIKGNSNRLTKEQIEQRKEAEERIKPKADNINPPSWLKDKAKTEFNRLTKELSQIDLVTNVDIDALALYCDAYVDYIECSDIISKEGLMIEHTNKAGAENIVPHPLMTKKKQLFDQMKSLANEFGLTPGARAKIAIPKKEEKKDPFGELLNE